MAGYEGKIKNQGSQYVKAPMTPGGKSGKSSVKKGGDLRSK